MNILKNLVNSHIAWIDSTAENSKPYNLSLLKMQASVTMMFVALIYFLMSLFTWSLSFKGVAFAAVIWAVLSIMFWVGQSGMMREEEKLDERFKKLCDSPESISEYFLTDNYGGKTVLGIVYTDGKRESFFEGMKAVSAHEQLKSAIQ